MSKSVLYLRWKLTNRVELFVNLGKLYKKYDRDQLGISRHTLNRKDLFVGWESQTIEIKKLSVQ